MRFDCPTMIISMWRHGVALLLPAAVSLLLLSCAPVENSERLYRMGELTAVGPVIYNVLEAEWRGDIGVSLQQKIPEHRFLLIRLTLTNSGNQDVPIPLLSLEDHEGNSYLEVSDIAGVQGWLGLLRILEPASTIQGVIVFDVPSGEYRLRVTDGGELDEEQTALVVIPLTFEGASPVDLPGLPQPDLVQ